eukprot:2515076-Pyramimonas_sp.AAC.1
MKAAQTNAASEVQPSLSRALLAWSRAAGVRRVPDARRTSDWVHCLRGGGKPNREWALQWGGPS